MTAETAIRWERDDQGVVTLTGEARSAEAKELAGHLAATTDGVSEVHNLLSSNLDGLKIDVATDNGMVRLAGQVPSSTQKELAVETARNIRGVRGVDADAVLVQPVK